MAQVQQMLRIYLKSGQNIEVWFNAEKLNELNPQINKFLQELKKKDKENEIFEFGGQRLILIRLDDVIAADAMSFEKKETQEPEVKAESKA